MYLTGSRRFLSLAAKSEHMKQRKSVKPDLLGRCTLHGTFKGLDRACLVWPGLRLPKTRVRHLLDMQVIFKPTAPHQGFHASAART